MGAALSAAASSISRRADGPSVGQKVLSSASWGAASGAVRGAWSPNERWRPLTLPPVTLPALAAAAAPKTPVDTVRTP
jgi:hypothetical protein